MRCAAHWSTVSHKRLECSADVSQSHVCAHVSQSHVCADVIKSHVCADVSQSHVCADVSHVWCKSVCSTLAVKTVERQAS